MITYKANITISSAGHIEIFNEWLRNLKDKALNSIEDISNEALLENKVHDDNTGFIVTTDTDIYCIKDNIVEKRDNDCI